MRPAGKGQKNTPLTLQIPPLLLMGPKSLDEIMVNLVELGYHSDVKGYVKVILQRLRNSRIVEFDGLKWVLATKDPDSAYLSQLRLYAEWEQDHFPDDLGRIHVLDWAIARIEDLTEENNRLLAKLKATRKED